MNKKHREVIVLIGKPGSGKGTQAEPLARALGIPFVSVGKLLREEIKRGTAIGKKAAEDVSAGRLVPNEMTAALIKRRLAHSDTKNGIVVDGCPRDLVQAKLLDKAARVTHAILISITDTEAARRISGRRLCSKCGLNYHIESNKPKKAGVCDRCGGEIVRRDDDKPKVIRERLLSYQKDTIPVLQYYRGKRILRRVDGLHPIKEVGKHIVDVIKKADAL